MLLAVPMLVGLLILARPIMILVAGDDFVDAAPILQILSIAVFGVYLGAVFGHTAVAIDKQKQTMWIYISDAIITLIGYLIFIPRYGMMGGAWMTVFSELYAGILLWVTIHQYVQKHVSFKQLGKILLASLIMGGVLMALPMLHVLLLVVIGAAVFSVMLYMLKGISKKTLSEIVSTNR